METNGDELSINLYLQSEINFCFVGMPDATFLHHCLQKHHQHCIILSRIQALDNNKSVASLAEMLAISFLHSKCSTFPVAWVCGQSYASISHTLPKCAR